MRESSVLLRESSAPYIGVVDGYRELYPLIGELTVLMNKPPYRRELNYADSV